MNLQALISDRGRPYSYQRLRVGTEYNEYMEFRQDLNSK